MRCSQLATFWVQTSRIQRRPEEKLLQFNSIEILTVQITADRNSVVVLAEILFTIDLEHFRVTDRFRFS